MKGVRIIVINFPPGSLSGLVIMQVSGSGRLPAMKKCSQNKASRFFCSFAR